jgi:AbrB family looped-hinge helix DNA binding protein
VSRAVATTRMSSRGQVVIPESIRDRLGLEAGAQFAVFGQDGVVMLKVISPPSTEEYSRLRRRLRQQTRAAGLKRSEIPKAIERVRGRR